MKYNVVHSYSTLLHVKIDNHAITALLIAHNDQLIIWIKQQWNKQTNSCSIVAGWQPLDRKHVIILHFYTIALFPFV